MRAARTLLLICAAALAAVALASNASAVEAVEIDHEDGTNCAPCLFHATGESEIHHPTFGEIFDCQDEIEGEIYHTWTSNPEGLGHWGHIFHWNAEHHPVDGDCTRENCDGQGGEAASEGEWAITEVEENSANQGEMHVRFCLDSVSEEPEGAGTHCTAHFIWTDHNNHNIELNTTTQCPTAFGDVTFTADWETEAPAATHDEIDIVHLGVPSG